MATDDIKKIVKGIRTIIATAGAVGVAKGVADSSNKKKSETKIINNSESVESIIEELNRVRDEINQMFEERQVQEQMDEMWAQEQMEDMWAQEQMEDMWALHDTEQEEFQNMGENSMDRNNLEGINYRNSYNENNDVDDYDEDDYDEELEDEIDNTELRYSGNNICIVLNESDERRNRLDISEKNLCRRFERVKELPSGERLQLILDRVFPEGFNKQMYIRNLTFNNKNTGYDVRILGIRPERILGDGLDELLPEGSSLIFKGHVYAKQFVVDAIYETADTERLDFEVDCVATPYKNQQMVGSNFLYDVLEDAGSLTEYTGQRLEEWNEYLAWKKELAGRQIHGCKYYKVTFNEETKRLVFWLVCESKEYFQAFRKYLFRDIQVFDNNYSTDKWHFEFNSVEDSYGRKQRFNSVELGRCKGVKNEYYLKDQSEVEDTVTSNINDTEAEYYDEYDDYYDDVDDNLDVEVEENISQVFTNPYIVQVEYELSRNDIDEINHRNLDEDALNQYVYDYVLGNYFPNGFLALSAIGEFVLINRFSQAINQLQRDECYSPNLAMWLFNVERARIPGNLNDVTIERWLNERIARNENQKLAVQKMLAAPDLCLIQGPPGTGKTTVIAEAIYQFVIRGNRVLVASQSNDAVDNALERLADTPEIRAIRLGQKGRRKRKNEDLSTRKFSEDEALKYYYHALSLKISNNWINMWDELDKGCLQYDIDIRDARLFNSDISELNKKYEKQSSEYEELRAKYNSLNSEISKANEYNSNIQNEIIQYHLFEDQINGTSEEQYYLSESSLRVLENVLNPLVDKTTNLGVYLLPGIIDVDITGSGKENAYIFLAVKNIAVLNNLKSKISKLSSLNDESDGEVIILQRQYDDIKQKMMEAIEEDDEDEEAKYKKQVKEIKKKLDEMKYASNSIQLYGSERHILSKDFIEFINHDEKNQVITIIDNVVSEWLSALKEASLEIGGNLSAQKTVDVEALTEEMQLVENKYLAQKDEMQKTKEHIISKRQTINKLREKYKLETTKIDEIIEHIANLKEKSLQLLEKQRGFRNEWEKTLRTFRDKLEDKDSLIYDQEHYQKIYINACNVVGISCTDNMRNLSDNGYDDFDVVIIDEVSKATPPELLIPLMKARKAILVGDHRQLPPMFQEHEGSYKELTENQENMPEEIRNLMTADNFKRFKKMVTSSLFKDYFEQADNSIKHSLLVQYRMHSDIKDIINRFYDMRLENGLSAEDEKEAKRHDLLIKGVDNSTFVLPDRHAYWIDSSALPNGTPIYETFINNSTSANNVLEKYIILELLKKIAMTYKEQGYTFENRKTVGVISFYQMQVNELRDALKEVRKDFDFSAIDIDINTVDRFQGKEKNIIITSLVRNNKAAKASKHVVTFERINVAFSRAQELLFIVGSKHMYENILVELPNMDMPGFRTVPVYKNIMDDLQRKACFSTCNKLITPDLEKVIYEEYEEYEENGGKQWLYQK